MLVAAKPIQADAVLRTIQESSGGMLANHLNPIVELARHIPAYSGNFLEWHLGKSDNPFDFIYRVYDKGDAPLLALRPAYFGNNSIVAEGYQNLIDHPSSGFRHGIENLFFEYDFPNPGMPSVFFDLNRRLEPSSALKYDRLADVCGYFQFALPPGLSELLRDIQKHGFSNLHFGLMLSRKSKAIRLTINRFESDRLNELIKIVGWPGDKQLIQALDDHFFKTGQKVMLAFDFDGNCGQRLGIELCQPDLQTILPQLENNGLVNPEQSLVLKEWDGFSELPQFIAESLADLHQRPVPRVYRCVHHFKFIIEQDVTSAKAYLYYCF